MTDGSGAQWTDPRYAGVVEHLVGHAKGSDHRARRPRAVFGGMAPAFLVRTADGKPSSVHCCGCLQVS